MRSIPRVSNKKLPLSSLVLFKMWFPKGDGQFEGIFRSAIFALNDALRALEIQKRRLKRIPKTIDPRMV
jgi:hypothetical protein